MSIRYFVTAISSSACRRNFVTVTSLLVFMYFVMAISSAAYCRNLVTEVSLVLAKYLVIAISSSTCSSCLSRGYSMSRNLVTVMSLDAWSRNLVTVVSRKLVTVVSFAVANC